MRRRRILAGLDQKDLARETALHQTYISMLERGKRSGTAKTIGVIARALGCEIADLVTDPDSDGEPEALVA
jgi:transcriptional regulator with XRE-family HTH domain